MSEEKECESFVHDTFGYEYGLCCNDGQRYCREINDCYYKQLQTAKEENETFTQQNKQMKEALEFYANNKHLIFSDETEYNEFFKLHDDKRYHYLGAEDFSMFYENGDIAQQSLKVVE